MKSSFILVGLNLLLQFSLFSQSTFNPNDYQIINSQIIKDWQASQCTTETTYCDLTDYKSKFRTFHLKNIYQDELTWLPFEIFYSENGAPPFYFVGYGSCRALSFSTPLKWKGHYFITFNDEIQPTSIHIDALQKELTITLRGECLIHHSTKNQLKYNKSPKSYNSNIDPIKSVPQSLIQEFQNAPLIQNHQLSKNELAKPLKINVPYKSFFPNQQTIVNIYYQATKDSPIYRMTEFSAIAISKVNYVANKHGIYYASFQTTPEKTACRIIFKQEVGNKQKKQILSNCPKI